MTLIDMVERMLEYHNISYIKGKEPNDYMIRVPYVGMKDKSNKINVYLDIDEELKIIRFSFWEKMREEENIVDTKSLLLDMNFSLQYGYLAMKQDSDIIEYRIDYILDENKFLSFSQYNIFIIHCVNVFETLKEKEVI